MAVALNEISSKIIGCAIEVHRALGPGLLESTYELCLAKEFELQDVSFQRQLSIPINYKGVEIDAGYRLDFLVEDQVVVELKAVTQLLPVFSAQVLTYMKLTKCALGLLLNFNEPVLKDGIKRFKL